MNPLGPGQTLDGKYQILRTLGEGGMGVVYEAHHLRLEQQVAVKCLLPALVEDRTLVARFEREARAAARLRSRHVVKILDVANDSVSGMPYMVMELLQGRDLQGEAAANGGQIPAADLTEWICQVAGALAEAHEAGVVHRDLKPSNIFICDEPDERIAKVLDFGIAKANAIVPGITYTTAGAGSICGTPHYMSPEQITAAEVDGRSDVWALAVVTYEMLSGKVPFDAQSFTALAVKIVNEHPIHLAKLRPDLPVDLCDGVMRGLHKDVALRHQTMREFAETLAPFTLRGELPTWIGKLRLNVRRLPSDDSTPRIDHSPTLAATSAPTHGAERKRGLVWAVASVGALFVVGGAAIGLRVASSTPPNSNGSNGAGGMTADTATSSTQSAQATSAAPSLAPTYPTPTATAPPSAEPATSSSAAKKPNVPSTKPSAKPTAGGSPNPIPIKPAGTVPPSHL